MGDQPAELDKLRDIAGFTGPAEILPHFDVRPASVGLIFFNTYKNRILVEFQHGPNAMVNQTLSYFDQLKVLMKFDTEDPSKEIHG